MSVGWLIPCHRWSIEPGHRGFFTRPRHKASGQLGDGHHLEEAAATCFHPELLSLCSRRPLHIAVCHFVKFGRKSSWPASPGKTAPCCSGLVITFGLIRLAFEVSNCLARDRIVYRFFITALIVGCWRLMSYYMFHYYVRPQELTPAKQFASTCTP